MAAQAQKFPADIVDCHHHFIEPQNNAFQGFLKSLGAPNYTCEQYASDCGALPISKTVHVEAMPDDGVAEAAWVESLADRHKVAAVVAKCDLSAPDAATVLDGLAACTPKLRGIRFILDYDGPFGEDNATHVHCSLHGLDYLRDPEPAAAFERGFASLAARGLSFDLQCCPAQLPAAAALCAKHPDVAVVIDHLGKPRHLSQARDPFDAKAIDAWRRGMALMAAQPQVCVKLSMLGFAVPGWTEHDGKRALVKSLVKETVDLFGPDRCMFASNWHINGAVSNSDGADACEVTMSELYATFQAWVDDWGLDAAAQRALFAGTAAKFYRL